MQIIEYWKLIWLFGDSVVGCEGKQVTFEWACDECVGK